MPNEAKIKSEAFSGRQQVKCVKLMIGVGARALFASFWDGDPGPGGMSKKVCIAVYGEYRPISTDIAGFGV